MRYPLLPLEKAGAAANMGQRTVVAVAMSLLVDGDGDGDGVRWTPMHLQLDMARALSKSVPSQTMAATVLTRVVAILFMTVEMEGIGVYNT